MPELGPYGSVRGARGNSRPYRESDQPTVRNDAIDSQWMEAFSAHHESSDIPAVSVFRCYKCNRIARELLQSE